MARGGTHTNQSPLQTGSHLEDDYPTGSLIVVAGIPGAGKSTLARAQFPGAMVVNPDKIRGEIYNSAGEWDQSASRAAFAKAFSDLEKNLKAGHTVVFDATNLQSRSIKDLVKTAERLKVQPHLIVLDVPLQTALERNALRGQTDPMRFVPQEAVERFHSYYENLNEQELKDVFTSVKRLDDEVLQGMVQGALRPTEMPYRQGREVISGVLMSKDPAEGLREMAKTGQMRQILPEVADTIGFDQQSKYHSLELFEHLLSAVDAAAKIDADEDVRMAALLHDIGKPPVAWVGDDGYKHFYGKYDRERKRFLSEDHEITGARMAEKILREMQYEPERVRKIVTLVRHHMAKNAQSPQKARKLLTRVGPEHIDGLLQLHACDRAAHKPEDKKSFAEAERLLALERKVIEGAQKPEVPVERLAIKGGELRDKLGLKGPQIGEMVQSLTEMVKSGELANDYSEILAHARKMRGRGR